MARRNQAANINGQRLQMERFTELYSSTYTDATNLTVASFPPGGEVEMCRISQDSSDAIVIGHTHVSMCNDPDNKHATICANYLTAISSLFPGLFEHGVTTMRQMGYAVRELTLTELSATVELLERIEVPQFCAIIGQIILLLYKYINIASYDALINAQANGLKAAAGYTGNLFPNGNIAINMTTASVIRTMLGCSNILRSNVLMELLRNRDASGPLGGVCGYLCETLKWTEMDSIVLISDTLVLTKSPVLRNLALRSEVRNVAKAFQMITSSNYPEYFKILQPPSATSVLYKSRFPILAAVARGCRANRYGTVGRW